MLWRSCRNRLSQLQSWVIDADGEIVEERSFQLTFSPTVSTCALTPVLHPSRISANSPHPLGFWPELQG
jgi:hypothetical protein